MKPNPITLSISIVIYNPNITLLEKVFSNLKTAILYASENILTNVSLDIVGNALSHNMQKKVSFMLDDFFDNVHHIKSKLINNPKNIGYGAANNLSIQQVESKYHLVMNPDVFVQKDTLLSALKYMETHIDIGLLVPDVCGEDGIRHYLCKQNPTIFDMFLRSYAPNFVKNKFLERMQKFEMRDKNYDMEIRDVPFPTGCFMFMRTEVLKKLNGFDEQFFLYYEDADIGRRLLNISHSAYVPEVKIVHQWARESRKNVKMLLIFIRSAFLYWKKYGGLF